MAKISRDLGALVGLPLHPRENLGSTATLGALNATFSVSCDGCSTVAIDVRGTFNLTIEVQGSVDGTNWTLIPLRPQLGGSFVRGLVGSAAGVWMAACAGFTLVRAFVTAYTSGSATTALVASTAPFDDFARYGGVTPSIGTVTAAVGIVATLTLAAPGVGLRHYLTYLSMVRVNGTATALTASATPVVCTTANLPGSLAFTRAADALAAGAADPFREDFAYPLMSVAQNTATSVTCPATTGVIWRITAGFFVAP